MRRATVLGGVLAAIGASALTIAVVRRPHVDPGATVRPPGPPSPATSAPADPPADPGEPREEDRAFAFRLPSGAPSTLTCDEARLVTAQVRDQLAYAPRTTPRKPFIDGALDWLDPHTLWSLAADAPTRAAFTPRADAILMEIDGRRAGECKAAREVGASLSRWVRDLRASFDAGRKATDGRWEAALTAIPTGGEARKNAFEIGRRVAAFEREVGDDARAYGETARARFFPDLDELEWSKVVLSASVRAYVSLVDPHSAWAPFDEEASIYEIDLAAHPPAKPWGKATTTAVGVVVTDLVNAPFEPGDLVLAVAGVKTAALPLEQVEQLGYAASDGRGPASASVVRAGRIVELTLGKPPEEKGDPAATALPFERVPYGDGDVVIVPLRQVPDHLGDLLLGTLRAARQEKARPPVGFVLDLRGNGGGSAEGALAALAPFAPNVPMFPTKRRDGTIEIDRTMEVRAEDRWDGPVAAFVDGATASAAEMIAGALAAYGRGPVLGTLTFGKGCEQEYIDDDAHTGILRLTTLLYALPDGSPVQRTGITPTIRFPFARADEKAEREETLEGAPPSFRGPDVRAPVKWPRSIEWAQASPVGPCKEPEICRALAKLGGHRSAVAKH
jgi:carboxyl-terminal processing protease